MYLIVKFYYDPFFSSLLFLYAFCDLFRQSLGFFLLFPKFHCFNHIFKFSASLACVIIKQGLE